MSMSLVPQIWVDVLVESHLHKVNAMHRTLQLDKLEDWAREFAQGELAYALAMLQSLGYQAVLHDNIYQLEK